MAAIVPAKPADPAMPPPCYGLAWQDLGVEVIDGRRVRRAEAPMTDRFHRAWGHEVTVARRTVMALGFDWVEAPGTPPHGMLVTYRSRGDTPTEATMASMEAQALDEIEADQLRRAERRAFDAGRDGEIRDALATALTSSWWAMPAKDAGIARDLLRLWTPDRSTMLAALAIIERSRAVVKATAVKLRAEGSALADADLCADPNVQVHVHSACRYLSAYDGDHATEANGEGWSRSTSRPGHWLSDQEVLDARCAAIGLRLVRKHRRQLPQDLRAALGLAA